MVNLNDAQKIRRPEYGILTGHEDNAELVDLFLSLDLSDLDVMTIRDLIRMGSGPDDPLLIGMLALMFAALAEGSLCIHLDGDGFYRRVSSASGLDVARLAEGFVRRMHAGQYDWLICRDAQKVFKPLVLDDSSGQLLLYFQKYHYHERRLKRRLEYFLSLSADRRLPAAAVEKVIDALFRDGSVIRKGPGGDPIVRDPCQVEAIRLALLQPLLVVSGGPGTGKTSMLANMLRALVKTGCDPSKIHLAAPTGRAAQRMGEALAENLASVIEPEPDDHQLAALSGSTLHRLLAYSGRIGGFSYNKGHRIPADVVVVDEVSMVDVVMMDRLFQAIDPTDTRVILLGDKDQLPSVDAGAVLADIKPVEDDASSPHFVELRTVYRSGGQLLKLSRAINSGEPVALRPVSIEQALQVPIGRWAFIASQHVGEVERLIDQWCRHRYLKSDRHGKPSYVEGVRQLNDLLRRDPLGREHASEVLLKNIFDTAGRYRVLTLLRSGPRGASGLNDRIAYGLRQMVGVDDRIDTRLFTGALIMITRNDHARGLTNGDIGVVTAQHGGGYQVFFNRSGRLTSIPAARLSDWDLAFAMTVHKSQGAEFEDALLVLPDDPMHRLLTREIIYTAATRAARSLIIYGAETAFETALQRKIVRQSGLILKSKSSIR